MSSSFLEAAPPLPPPLQSVPPPVITRTAPPGLPARHAVETTDDDENAESPVEEQAAMFTSAFLISTAFHTVLLLLLACLYFGGEDKEPLLESTLAMEEGDDGGMLDDRQIDVPQSPARRDAEKDDPAKAQVAAPQLAGLNKKVDLNPRVFGGAANGAAAAAGGGRVSGLFGSGREADSFVFVVDSSLSMEGQRFELAVQELIRVIDKMRPTQKFYVYFYSTDAYPLIDPETRLPYNKLLEGNDENKRVARRWINKQLAIGGTVPMDALFGALALKPQVIYFLTDGELPVTDPPLDKLLANRNKAKTVIHTIALGADASTNILQKIAERNRGRFRHVR